MESATAQTFSLTLALAFWTFHACRLLFQKKATNKYIYMYINNNSMKDRPAREESVKKIFWQQAVEPGE